MKVFWWKAQNFGDTLTPHIIKHFLGVDVEYVPRETKGKVLAVGSILHCIQEGDLVWGTGTNRTKDIFLPKDVKVFALRGQETAAKTFASEIRYNDIDIVYGDPALLLPLMYKPEIKKTHKVGYLPHYVDKKFIPELKEGEKYIDIQADWKTVIEEVLSCETIIASSLHGIIVAEAYGIPAIWAKYSDKIIGGDFKFQDYFIGTGRGKQQKDVVIPSIEPEQLTIIQDNLISALHKLYAEYKRRNQQ